MPSVMEIVLRARDQASQVIEGVGESGARAGSWIEDNWGKASVALAAGGAAIEGMARKQAPATEQSRRLAASLGMSESAVRDLAIGMSNVTFPLQDALDLMETGRQRGIKSAEQLEEYATFWDMVGDATGGSGPALGKAGAALEAVGVTAGNEKDALAAFGFITEETTGSVDDFLKFLDRSGPELRTMGADVDDAAAILGVLEGELGMSARTARTEFQAAVIAADGDMDKMLDTLGLTQEQFETYRSKVEASSGVIERNADIHAQSYTPIQRLQHGLSELAFRFGGVTEGASTLAPILIAAGPAMRGVKAASDLLGKEGLAGKLIPAIRNTVVAIGTKVAALASWAAATAAQGARAVASMAVTAGQFVAHYARMAAASLANAARMAASWVIAMGPVGWVIAAIVALVALIIANWDKVKRFTKAAWDAIVRNVIDPVVRMVGRVVEGARELRDRVVGFFRNLKERAVEAVTDLRDRVVDGVRNLKDRAVGVVLQMRDNLVGNFRRARDLIVGVAVAIKDRVLGALTTLRDNAVQRLQAIVDFVTGLPGKIAGLAGRMLSAGAEFMGGMWDGIRNALGQATSFAANIGRQIANAVIRFVNDRVIGSINRGVEFRIAVFGKGVDINPPDIPSIPTLHSGGLFRAPRPGGEGLALLRDREQVFTPEQMAGAGAGERDVLGQIARLLKLLDRRLSGPLTLRVGDREFIAFLRDQAAAVLDRADADLLLELAAGQGAS